MDNYEYEPSIDEYAPKISAVGKRRLMKLRELLLQDARRNKGIKFDLATWGGPVTQAYTPGYSWARGTTYDVVPEVIPLDCNTHACAVGLACISGAFKKAGLTYDVSSNTIEPLFQPRGRFGVQGWDAVEQFFCIGPETAEMLFSGEEYRASIGAVAERKVAKRIKALVDGRKNWARVE